MSLPQEPGKSLPPTEYSLKSISWHAKETSTSLKMIAESLQEICHYLRATQGRAPTAPQKLQPSNGFSSNDIPF